MELIELSPRMDVDPSLRLRSPGDVLLLDYMLPATMNVSRLARRTGIRMPHMADHLEIAFQLPPYEGSNRFRTSIIAGSLALEHGEGVRTLLSQQLGVSAAVVLRAQYEATLRSVWVCYVAKEEEVMLLSADLSPEAERRSKSLPQAGDMLSSMEGIAPASPVTSLRNFRTHSWAALNSYVHAGLHSLNRHASGLPLPIARDALKSSNGLSVVAAMQCAVATGSQALVREVGRVQTSFADCLPTTV